jgi:dipeptide transport system ATP-binding protein
MSLLEVRNLTVRFGADDRSAPAVECVDLSVAAGEIVGLVGESGSGKSASMLALMGLIDAPGRVSANALRFDGNDLRNLGARRRRHILGRDIAMIFQDPLASLNPSFTIGYQLREAIRTHDPTTPAGVDQRALELLETVEIASAKSRLNAYPHQLSGGMNQRVMIAMAISCSPKLLIADEPTTALDVTIQAQILELLRNLQRATGMAMILVSHDLAVVAEMAQRALVMYAGQIVESGTLPRMFETPRHPYTAALLAATPERNRNQKRLSTIPGVLPGAHERPRGCLFTPRCRFAFDRCSSVAPALEADVRCHTPLDSSGTPIR